MQSEPDTTPLLSRNITKENEDDIQGDEGVKLTKAAKVYAKFIYDHPLLPIIFIILLTIMFTLILVFYYGLMPSANTNYYRWNGDDITQKWDAYVGAAEENYGSTLGMLGGSVKLPSQFQLTQMGCVIFENKDGNMLDYKIIREIWKMEDEMRATPGWADHCFKIPMNSLPDAMKKLVYKLLDYMKNRLSSLEEDTNCIAFKSLITDIKNYAKNTYNWTTMTHEDLNQSFLEEVIRNDEKRISATYFGNDYNNETMKTSRMRSMYPFALPLKGYKNKKDRQKEQESKLGKWQVKFTKPVDNFLERSPYGAKAYGAFVFALNYKIAALILKQVWWLVGSFAFLFVFAVFVQRSFFTSLLGVIGVFFPIPCATCSLTMFFGIEHIDVIDVIGLFLICGIGADCVFILFELFKQARTIYGHNNKLRLAYALQRGIIALTTSISTSAVSFLALVSSGVRIMNFFGVFCFLLLLYTFIVSFTWYLGILSIWSKKWEKFPEDLENSVSQSQLETNQEEQGDHEKYPYTGVFDFLTKCPKYDINSAGLDIKKFNKYEQFVYNKLAPFLYHYRLPIVIIFLLWSASFGSLAFKMKTKSELQFLPDMHPLQRAYGLAYNGFQTALNDFSFVYVWGLEEKVDVPFKSRFTIDDYGRPRYRTFNITDPTIQMAIHRTWEIINSDTTLIDAETTKNFGVSPWEMWSFIFKIDAEIEKYIPLKSINITLPTDFPIEPKEYSEFAWLWQIILSELVYEEPDSYVPGTLKANTVGFNPDDYKLRYIGMKANMKIPKDSTVETMRDLYKKAESLANKIDYEIKKNLSDFSGFHTGVAWNSMVTEEMLPKQVVKDVALAFAIGAVVILISTCSFLYTALVVYSMTCTVFLIMGILYLIGWKIGTNEAIMISIASGFCADFIIQPMLALSHDTSSRSLFGKIQASLTTFATPVSSALVTTLVAACFLYPCDILLFPPFASFLLGSGIFGILHGFVILPALIALFSCKSEDKEEE